MRCQLMLLKFTFFGFCLIRSAFSQTLKVNVPNKVIETNYTITYPCKFNQKVDCLWQIDGGRIIVESYDYKYVNGKSTDTHDCSITANLTATKPNFECTGIINYDTSKTNILENSAVKLNCTSVENVECSWKRNGTIINISKRYKYLTEGNGINTTDCSIAINNATSVDETTWICYSQANDQNHVQALAAFNLQLVSEAITSALHDDVDPLRDNRITMAPSSSNTNSINLTPTVYLIEKETSPQSSSDKSEERLVLYITVSSLGTALAIAIIIATVIQIRKCFIRSQNITNSRLNDLRMEAPPTSTQIRNDGTDDDGYLIANVAPRSTNGFLIHKQKQGDRIQCHDYAQIN